MIVRLEIKGLLLKRPSLTYRRLGSASIPLAASVTVLCVFSLTARHPDVAPNAAEHGRDYVELNALLDELFGKNNSDRPRVQGPDVCFGQMSDTSPCADIKVCATGHPEVYIHI